MDQVWQGIRGADVVVADVTGSNPNVMIEVGMAAALGKEVIVISQSDMLPFDIRHWRRITYAPADLPRLEEELVRTFGAVSAILLKGRSLDSDDCATLVRRERPGADADEWTNRHGPSAQSLLSDSFKDGSISLCAIVRSTRIVLG